MAVISKNAAIAEIHARLRRVGTQINIEQYWINLAAGTGVVVSPTLPTDNIAARLGTIASGTDLTKAIQAYTTMVARTLRLQFVLAANRFGDATGNEGIGRTDYFYGYVPRFVPSEGQLAPTTPSYDTSIAAGQTASVSKFLGLLDHLDAKIKSHADANMITVNYCHNSCHDRCHTSRGRR